MLSLLSREKAYQTRRLVILGVSGSVGSTAVDYLKLHREIELVAFSVHSSVDRIHILLKEFSVKHVSITSPGVFDEEIAHLQTMYPRVKFYRGSEGIMEMISTVDCDTVLTGIVGSAGIEATICSLRLGKKIALANKETMVTAGPAIEKLILDLASQGILPTIIPVDSEHNTIFQLLQGVSEDSLEKVILTASGGPFRELELDKLSTVTKEEVLNHPTWSMGPKITVDSAGMINKGLEIIEAHHLFSVPYSQLGAMIHRHSIVHGMVTTTDGGYLLGAANPGMVFPIAHALHYPAKVPEKHAIARDPTTWPPLSFEEISAERYPGYFLALQCGETGGTHPAIFNAANEVAVDLFLRGRIGFVDVFRLIQKTVEKLNPEYGTELGLYLSADEEARKKTREEFDRSFS